MTGSRNSIITIIEHQEAMRVNSIIFFANTAIFTTWFYVPIFATDDLHLNELDIGVLFMLHSLALFISSHFFGILSDRIGRKRFLFFGFAISSITFGLQAGAWDFWSLLAVRIAAGFSIGIYPAALLAYVYEARKQMGKFSSFGSLGFGFGALMGGITADLLNVRYAFLLSAGMFLISFFFVINLPAPGIEKQRVPFFPIDVIKKNRMVYFSMLMRHSGAHTIWVIFPLLLRDLGATIFWIGVVNALNAFSQFFYMYYLTDKYPSRFLVTIGLLLSVLVFILFLGAGVWWQFLPLQLLLAASWAFLYVGSLKFVTEQNVERATASGMLNSILSLSAIFGAIVGGAVAFYFSKQATIGVAIIMSALGTLAWIIYELKVDWKNRGDLLKLHISNV